MRPAPTDATILSPGQVAALFGVHPRTVFRWADTGKLPGFKTPGGKWRFRREDVDGFTVLIREGVGE